MKKIISLLLSVVLLLSTISVQVFADSADSSEVKSTSGDSALVQTLGETVESEYTLLSSGTTEIWSESKKLCTFTYDGTSCIYSHIKAEPKYSEEATKTDITFAMVKGQEYVEENIVEKEVIGKGYAWLWYDSDSELVKDQEYSVWVVSDNDGTSHKITYRNEQYSGGYAKTAKINNGKYPSLKAQSKYYVYRMRSNEVGKLPLCKSVKTSSSSIAKAYNYGDCIAIYAIKKGTAKITVTLKTGNTFSFKVYVKNGTPVIKWKSYTLYRGQSFRQKIYYNSKKVKWSTTKKKVATVSSKGKVKAKGVGTCYIKAKVAGKTLKCKVRVYRRKPNFAACMWDYSNRGKWISVRFVNKGSKSLKVYSKSAKYLDCDFTFCDRKLKLSKGSSIVIKPKKAKTVKFKIKSGGFWWKPWGSTIRYYFKYDGKKYKGRAYDEFYDSDYLKSSKSGYYYSYWENTSWAKERDDYLYGDDDYDY